uniref:Glycine-rich protein n=1 Tax=Lilium formosanum TaxID=63788 RepID=A7YFB9_9LILI|nr:glycine-rich protein [Lilium formosanum]
MASKALLMLGVLIVAALFVTSDAGRELAEETKENTEERVTEAGVTDQKYGGYSGGGGYPGGGGYHNGGGYQGGGGGYHNGGGYQGGGGGYHNGGGGGRCYNGCCRRGYYGGCQCCAHPDEIPDPEYRAESTYGHP